jgi:lipopolysaccharide/colanic/teichoic acid biosynthesis glycosyltransferase
MPDRRVARIVKNCCDRVIAAVAVILLCPLWIVVGLLVWATSSGPIIYRRRVVGLNGVEFDAFKFRTMVAEADRLLHQNPELRDTFARQMKVRDDPRRTPLGRRLRKTSLDELPQLFNVLRGEMSLVGPRMIAPDEVPRYGAGIHKRLMVKPGITGLWQVSGRQDVSYDKRVELDLRYVDNWSLWLDLVILLKTIPAVLGMKGAY